MSRPISKPSLEAATSATAGEAQQVKGHNSLALLIEADNLDTTNDTLDAQIEVRRGGGNWTPIRNESGTEVGVVSAGDFADPEGDGTYAVFLYIHGVPADEARLRITSFTDNADSDLSVNGYIQATGNAAGRGHRYEV